LRLNSWLEEVYDDAEKTLEEDHSLIQFISITQNMAYGSFSISPPSPQVSNQVPTRTREQRQIF
jgi:hypothetical protein